MRVSNIKKNHPGEGKLRQIYERTILSYENMIEAFESQETDAIALTLQNAESIESMREEYKSEYLTLTSSGGYTVKASIIYSEAARHLARISHNIKSIAETINQNEDEDARINEIFDRR